MSAAPHELVAPTPSLAVVPDPAPAPSLADLLTRRAGSPQVVVPARPLREPTFDELVTGYGRHRGPLDLPVPASLLRRLALRARLLPTPARRPPARVTGTP